jgi:hypothetical protein
MKILDPGHKYELDQLDHPKYLIMDPLELVFVKREGKKYPGNLSHYPGTIIQEVLRACIDRLLYLHKQDPHWVNVVVIDALRGAIKLLEKRAYERHSRTYDLNSVLKVELLPTNSHGHLWKE